MTDIASLALKIDAGEVDKGAIALDKLTAAGGRAEQSAGRMASSYSGLGKMVDASSPSLENAAADSAKLDKELTALLSSINPAYAGLKKLDQGTDTLSRAFKAGLITAAQYKSSLALLESGFVKAAVETEKSILSNQRARQSLVTLGREIATGNFAAMPGTLARLASVSNISAAALFGIGGAAALAIAGVAGIGYAAYKTSHDLTVMNRALVLTGGYSGLMAQQAQLMASAISNSSDLTLGAARDMTVAFAATGKIGVGAFEAVMKASAAYATSSGMDAAKATEYMVKIFSDPAKGAEELNSTMHYLSLADMQHISDLQESGRVTEAQTVLATLLREELEKHPIALGAIESALINAKKNWSDYWDAAMGKVGGREKTLTEQIDDVRAGLKVIPKDHPNRAIYEAEERRLMSQVGADASAASAKAVVAEANAQDQLAMRYAKGNSDIAKRVELQNKLNLLTESFARQETGSVEANILYEALKKTQKQLDEVGKTKEKKKVADDNYIIGIARETEMILKAAEAAKYENEAIGKTAEQITALDITRIDEQISIAAAEAARLEGSKGRERELFIMREQIKGLLDLRQAREDKGLLLAAEKSAKEIAAAHEKEAKRAQQAWERFTTNVQRNLGDVLYNGLNGSFKNIGDAFKQMTLRMMADAAAANLTQVLLGSEKGGGLLGSIGSSFAGLFAPSYAGGGSTGNGPRSGGIDGMGGFMAVLHPNETVVDHTKSGSNSKAVTVIQNINIDSRSDQGTIISAMMRAKEMAKAEIMNSLNRGGDFSRAVGRA